VLAEQHRVTSRQKPLIRRWTHFFVAIVAAWLVAFCVQLEGAQSKGTSLTNADIVHFIEIGLPEQAIISLISEAQAAGLARFDLSVKIGSNWTDETPRKGTTWTMQP
jgi:hypothetical protein